MDLCVEFESDLFCRPTSQDLWGCLTACSVLLVFLRVAMSREYDGSSQHLNRDGTPGEAPPHYGGGYGGAADNGFVRDVDRDQRAYDDYRRGKSEARALCTLDTSCVASCVFGKGSGRGHL